MKKLITTLVVSVIALMGIIARAEGADARVVLMTVYRQCGWGDTARIGAVCADGSLIAAELTDGAEDLPYDTEALVGYITEHLYRERVGTLTQAELGRLKGLIATVADCDAAAVSVADDAGTQESVAVRYAADGSAEVVTLGMSGCDLLENTDPAAQALYRALRALFPDVTAHDGEDIAPKGFPPVSVPAFLGYDITSAEGLTLVAYRVECEEGRVETEPDMTVEEILGGTVTGMYSAAQTTGGSMLYCLVDGDGACVAAFEYYDGMLVTDRGMFTVR